MRVFHEPVFDGYVAVGISTIAIAWADIKFDRLCGSVDILCVSGFFTQLLGTGLTVDVNVYFATEGVNDWSGRNLQMFTPGTPTAGAEYVFQAVDWDPDATGNPARTPLLRVEIILNGTGAAGYLKAWATGRDYSRRGRSVVPGTRAMQTQQAAPGGAPMAMANGMPSGAR